jgi:hypothetical protein
MAGHGPSELLVVRPLLQKALADQHHDGVGALEVGRQQLIGVVAAEQLFGAEGVDELLSDERVQVLE